MSTESKVYFDLLSNAEKIKYLSTRNEWPEEGDTLWDGQRFYTMKMRLHAAFKGIPHTRATIWKANGNRNFRELYMVVDIFDLVQKSYDSTRDVATWILK